VTDLLQLAERCEAATGANKMLDEAIFEAAGIVPSRHHAFVYPHYAFTASVDAALTLVPEGAHYGNGKDSGGKSWAWVASRVNGVWQQKVATRWAATPALAICAAALRARAAQ
jgi:hypothetical protein